VLIIALLMVGYLIARAGLSAMPALPVSHERLLTIASGINFLLHPLVVLSISDQYTRAKVAAAGKPEPRIFGALTGEHNGLNMELINSFELRVDVTDGRFVPDLELLNQKLEQWKKVYPTHIFLGWYSVCSTVTAADHDFHSQLTPFNEAPLFLQLDPRITPATRELPITLFESETQVIKDQAKTFFVKTTYKIGSGEAERIGVDHIAHIRGAHDQASRLESHVTSLQSAVKMLAQRIKIILEFLKAQHAGSITKDHHLLRQCASIVKQLPAIDGPAFQQAFVTEYNDALLITYLASMTQSCDQVNNLIDKYNIAYDRFGRRSRFMM